MTGHQVITTLHNTALKITLRYHDTVASTDGFDTIVDFKFGVGGDKLDFSGITKDQFLASFVVDDTRNVDGVGGADTVISIAGNADWSLTLLEVSGHDLLAFSNDAIFS